MHMTALIFDLSDFAHLHLMDAKVVSGQGKTVAAAQVLVALFWLPCSTVGSLEWVAMRKLEVHLPSIDKTQNRVIMRTLPRAYIIGLSPHTLASM